MKDTSFGEKLKPLVERIQKLTVLQGVLIYALMIVLLAGGFVYFSYMPKYQRLQELETEFQDLETKLARARQTARQLPALKKELADAEVRFNTVQRALPEKQEIPSLLASVSRSGSEVGLDFLLFQPKTEVGREFYAEIPVDIRVQGSFHSVGLFFDRVAHLPRIVNILDVTMVPEKGAKGPYSSLVTSCTATTYKFLDAPPAQDKKPSPKRK
jgi:type IV pilus assembly protein PilO